MVAMQVADDHGVPAIEVHAVFAQEHLRAFGAVHEKVFLTNVHDLCAAVVSSCRECTAASEDSYFKFFHAQQMIGKRIARIIGVIRAILSCESQFNYFCSASMLAFSAARASMSPSVVLAALFWITGAASFSLRVAFFAATAAFLASRASARATSSKMRL